MPTLQWALICRRVITDQDTNSVSYIDLVEGLTAAQLPLPLPPIMLATLWRRESHKDVLQMRVRVESPKQKNLGSFDIPAEQFPPHIRRQRVNISLEGLPIEEAGDYWIIIDHKTGDDWGEVYRIPLEVQVAARQQSH